MTFITTNRTPDGATRQARTGARLHDETRRRLVAAAASEFTTRGYARATVGRIAASADVAVQTLYAAWGSKRELLRAVLTTALAGEEDPTARFVGELGTPDAATAVDRLAGMFVDVAARAGPVWRVYQDAAAVDAQISADWDDLHARRRHTIAALLEAVPEGALRMSRQTAVETVWTLASPETWGLLVGRGVQTADEYGAWLRGSLHRLLLTG